VIRAAQKPANGVISLATQVRSKPANKAPVTKHPLFPAMVALWFGALFGLGSLAVRASLLESLVLSLSLDVLLPAAAPPLGMKSRLILALLLAAIGVAVGAMLARRIARPKPVETPRKRGIGARSAARQARAEAANAELEPSAPRRRALTIEAEEQSDFHYDGAPLPGSAPSILDVTQIDLSSAPSEAPLHGAAEPFDAVAAAPLAHDDFVAEEAQPDAPTSFEAFAAAQIETVPESGEAPEIDRQVFRAAEPAPEFVQPIAEEPKPVVLNFHPPVDVAAPAPEAPLDLLCEHEMVEAGASPVEAESDDYASMIEALRKVETPAAPAWSPIAPEPIDSAPDDFAIKCESELEQVSSEPLPIVPQVLLAEPPALESAAAPQALAETQPTRRIETAELAELSPVELIERLAQAMRQRAHQGQMPSALVDAVASLVAASPAAEVADAEVSPFAGFAAEIAPAPVFDAVVPQPEAPEELLLDSEEPEAEPEVSQSAPLRLELPAALRPIDFDDYTDHDDSDDLAMPPRTFAAPKFTAPEAVLDLATPLSEESESGVPEDSYSSLLELGRAAPTRQDFVRIEEPEADDAEIEPVVIFPGHGARPGQRFAAPDPAYAAAPAPSAFDRPAQPDAASETGAPQLRRFDAPAAVASPTTSAYAGGIRQDPDEAQRALRSALATLQRMSGAA
jgi:hypothetical protein